jgi:hypothetical protein
MKPLLQKSLMLVAATLLSVGVCAQVTVQFHYGTPERPLQGRRYETMRALSHYLDERAQHAYEQAAATQVSGRRQRQFLQDISEFTRRADHFHDRMDHYLDSPYDLPGEVLALERRAQAVNVRIRDARVFPRTYEDWDAVLDVLNRMKQVLQGSDVEVPPAHRRDFRDYDRDYAPFQGQPGRGGQEVFAGSDQGELRRLADRLDDLASQASGMAPRGTDESFRGRSLETDLRRFNDDTRAVRQRADAGQIDRREMADSVNRLLAEAGQIDGVFGASNVSPQLRGQWQQVVDTLNRMSQILQQ